MFIQEARRISPVPREHEDLEIIMFLFLLGFLMLAPYSSSKKVRVVHRSSFASWELRWSGHVCKLGYCGETEQEDLLVE